MPLENQQTWNDLLILPSAEIEFWGTRTWAQQVYHPRSPPIAPAVLAPPAYIEGLCISFLSIFRLRQKSLPRAILLSLGAFAASLHLAGFPHIENLHGSWWQILALLVAAWGMAETARCLQRKWSLYHAGVLILLYADLMILAAIVVLLVVS